jgi:DNA integrity scanning protein DisA with diadenylate cyclase activity
MPARTPNPLQDRIDDLAQDGANVRQTVVRAVDTARDLLVLGDADIASEHVAWAIDVLQAYRERLDRTVERVTTAELAKL